MSAEDKLQKALVKFTLNNKAVFWSQLCFKLKIVEDGEFCKSVGAGGYVDGTHLGYDPDRINQWTTGQIVTFLAHEAEHMAQGHLWRIGARDQEIWWEAIDHVVNNDLVEAGFEPLENWLCDPRFKGMAAEQVYDILLKEREQGVGMQPPPGWNIGATRKPSSNESMPSLRADWEVATVAAAQAAKMAGVMPGFAKRLVDEIRKPVVDWKALLRRFMQQFAKADYSWSRPNPRFIQLGLYMPSLHSEQMPPIVIGGDTSGSIGKKTLDAFGAEMGSIIDECQPERTHVMWWDTRVTQVDVFERGDPLELNPVGGGGTCIADLFKRIEEDGIQPCCLVILTDMEIYDLHKIEEPEYPVIWCSTTERASSPFGELVYLSDVE